MSASKATTKTYYGTMFKECWHSLKWFRILLVITIVWVVFRLTAQLVFTFTGSASDQVGVDLQVYLNAAQHFVQHLDLYPVNLAFLEGQFPYPPMFAFLFIPFLWLPQQVTIMVHFLLHLAIYYLLFITWQRIFQQWHLEKASKFLILILPAWLIFSAFWDDLTYLNIYILMALLGTLLIESVLNENLFQSSIWLTLILISKPQWAFAAALPLFMGRYRFFIKMVAYSLAAYLGIALITSIAGGTGYVWTQFKDYVNLLDRIGWAFPWRGPDAGFLGYNHSIKQIFAYYLGNLPSPILIATLVKCILIVPIAIIAIHRIFHPIRQPEQQPAVILEAAFLLYLGAFIWLDVVWEASLAIVIFGYLLSALKNKTGKVILTCVFLIYAILDIWRFVCYIAGSPMINDSYLKWDYSIYIPTTMIVILLLYIIISIRLWPWRTRLHQAYP